jgi:hypothetical protein
MPSLDEGQLEQIEELLQERAALLEGRENRLEARLQSLEDSFGRQNVINQSGINDDNNIQTNDHIRDITSDRRSQLHSAGLEDTNIHLSELSNHELHKIKNMYDTQSDDDKKVSILDKPLGDTIDNTINFANNSFDNYTKSMYRSELLFKKELRDASFLEKIYLYLSSFTMLLRSDQNIIYMGIILIFFSNIIYFLSILIP